MSSVVNFRQNAMDHLSRAVELDREKKFQEAFDTYERGITYLTVAIKYEKEEKIKDTLRNRANEYLERAEELGAMLKPKQQQRPRRRPEEQPSMKPTGTPSKTASKDRSSFPSPSGNVAWSDIVGLEKTKKILHEVVLLPQQRPELFSGIRTPPRGILLYGPPGTGKSYISAALANEAGCHFISVTSADIMTKWLGESTQKIRELFEEAREKRPSIIFIDEIDALVSERGSDGGSGGEADRVKNQILTEMDGVGSDMDGILVLGATNRPWTLDKAMRRRLEKLVYIPLPDEATRAGMLAKKLEGVPHDLVEDEFQEAASLTEGFSGADIKRLAREAAMTVLREMETRRFIRCDENATWSVADSDATADTTVSWRDLPSGDHIETPPLSLRHIKTALETTPRSVAFEDLSRFETWTAEFGTKG